MFKMFKSNYIKVKKKKQKSLHLSYRYPSSKGLLLLLVPLSSFCIPLYKFMGSSWYTQSMYENAIPVVNRCLHTL